MSWKKINEYRKNFEEAIAEIELAMNTDNSIQPLVRWLMCSEANPYSYLPRSRAGLTNTAEGMLDLINEIHHAVYDDGDIAFALFNGCPVIIFACQHEADFADKVVKAFSHASDRRNFNTVEVVGDSISEFVDRLQNYHEKEMRRHFITTVSVYGVEFAKYLYSEYSGYGKLDIEQCLQEAAILKAIKEVDRGDFATEEEVNNVRRKWLG